jgi:outer membrane lipoprotein-sorting protein
LRIFLYPSALPRAHGLKQRGCDLRAKLGGVFLLALLSTVSFADADLHSPPQLSTDTIVQRLMAANAQRAQTLRGYSGKRVYRLYYRGIFGSHDAGMQVEATYTAPDRKDFKVISETGSSLLINHVLLKLLKSEQEAQEAQNRKELEISPQNYDFAQTRSEHTSSGDFYVLTVSPKNKSKYLYRGKLWVDAKDFAVARMQGEPARSPSIWVSHTEIEYRWAKFGDFWLPVHNESETQVRMGGKAVLTIDYSDYQITGASGSNAHGSRETSTLPAPSAVSADPH